VKPLNLHSRAETNKINGKKEAQSMVSIRKTGRENLNKLLLESMPGMNGPR
jgi:hypothetical protein